MVAARNYELDVESFCMSPARLIVCIFSEAVCHRFLIAVPCRNIDRTHLLS